MRLEKNITTDEYGFMINHKPQSIGYPQHQVWFIARQEAIDAANEMGLIVLEDGTTIGQA